MRTIMAAIVLLAVVGGILAAGCTGAGTEPLENTAWTLESIRDNQGSLVPVIAGSDITISFESEGSFSGSAGCNHYFGSYTAVDGVISTREIASTEMACLSPEGVMIQESRYLYLLGTAEGYETGQDHLSLRNVEGETVLVFQREG